MMSIGSSKEVLGDVEPIPRAEVRNAELIEHLEAQSNELRQRTEKQEAAQLKAASEDDKAKTISGLAKVRKFLQGK